MKPSDCVTVSGKQLAIIKLEALPETSSLHNIREELEILDSIQSGQKGAREGRTKSQEEVEKETPWYFLLGQRGTGALKA